MLECFNIAGAIRFIMYLKNHENPRGRSVSGLNVRGLNVPGVEVSPGSKSLWGPSVSEPCSVYLHLHREIVQ